MKWLTCEVEGDWLSPRNVGAHKLDLSIAGLKELLLEPLHLTPIALLF